MWVESELKTKSQLTAMNPKTTITDDTEIRRHNKVFKAVLLSDTSLPVSSLSCAPFCSVSVLEKRQKGSVNIVFALN